MEVCSVDFETRSTLDLRKTGVYPYAGHGSTEVLCMAYAIGDEDVKLWVQGMGVPLDLELHVTSGGAMRAWNAQFERVIWRDLLGPRHGFSVPKLSQWWCTMADALAVALPGSLGWAAEVLNLPEGKDTGGRALMLQMCKPRGFDEYGVPFWWDDPDRMKRLGDYCRTDVSVEREIAKRIRSIGPAERQVYLVDQRINDRGIRLDMDLVRAAEDVVARETIRANDRLHEVTGGEASKVTQVARLHGWVTSQGVEMEDLRKHSLRDALESDDLPADVREVLEIRRDIGKTSASKIKAMHNYKCRDGYARGLLQYHGASTGRWSGRGIQPQNFPRGEVKDVTRFIEPMLAGDEIDHEKPVVVVSSLLRSMMTASPGSRFISGDYSQIEARVLGWLANEPYGANEYEKMGALIFSADVNEIIANHDAGRYDERRQVGKNTILGCGFQMGWERYQEQAWEQTGLDLTEEICRLAVSTYRTSKPGIPAYWSGTVASAMKAIEEPGSIHHVGTSQVRYTRRGNFLWCILPSGRPLAYALPRVEMKDTKWGPRATVTYMGVCPVTRQWKRLGTYGGHLTENIVQATARDVMSEAMLRLDAAGYRPVTTVHDEVLCDTPNTHGSIAEFIGLMTQPPVWADGLPIAVDHWEGERYRK